jgi:hypothetical protein
MIDIRELTLEGEKGIQIAQRQQSREIEEESRAVVEI